MLYLNETGQRINLPVVYLRPVRIEKALDKHLKVSL